MGNIFGWKALTHCPGGMGGVFKTVYHSPKKISKLSIDKLTIKRAQYACVLRLLLPGLYSTRMGLSVWHVIVAESGIWEFPGGPSLFSIR